MKKSSLIYPPQYESGIRYVLITPLRNQMKLIGFVYISSTVLNAFTEDFKKILHGIAPQLSSAVSNIIKNEEIQNKEKEKSFLLDFSSEIATVRTKEELASAVSASVNKLNQKRGYVIRRINEDGATMTPYVFDMGEREVDPKVLNALVSSSYPINDGIQNRVLNSLTPVLLNVEKEIQGGIKAGYLDYWKKMGFEKLVAVRLRNGETNLGMLLIDIDEINVPLLQGICAQISIAMANIMANEQIARKQAEQTFLIGFSHDITRVRTKQDLQDAISTVLNKTMNTQFVMIRVIEDDGKHLVPFMFDRTLFEKANAKIDFDKMAARSHYRRRNLHGTGAGK
jgi:transcriptional regulator with GAF, ATPase, and Fis domain